MGFLSKLFGKHEEEKAASAPPIAVNQVAQQQSIPPYKVGFDGNFDENGLAKRVAKALDDADISDNVGLWVAQSGSSVILRYNEDAKSILDRATEAARSVQGVSSVQTEANA